MNIVPVILLGGSGTRLWPVSRSNHPKQFLSLTGDQTLLQSTLSRLEGIEGLEPPIILCNEEHRFTTAEQLVNVKKDPGDIILEPVGRNTAPAVTVAALHAMKKYKNSLLLVLPADHVIEDTEAFHEAIKVAAEAAEQDRLVTFGVVANKPETGYGYLKRGEKITDSLYTVERFVEKPEFSIAESYVKSGEYYWNSGMFLFKASVFLEELKQFNAKIFTDSKEALANSDIDLDFTRLDKDAFEKCPGDSIDYAVMERTSKAVTVPLNAGWNDIGSWSALWEIEQKNSDGNALHGDVLTHKSSNCLVRAEDKLVTLVGVDDLIVIETKDAVLVAKKDRVQDVKSIVQSLVKDNRSEAVLHREVYRPWGKYDGVDVGERFQVKRITVKPGQSTSMQMHYHRAEHWIVVSGMAEITCDDQIFLCTENQSAYIPQGSTHRIKNPGKLPMEMIEVQTGSYLGEDDIVRYEDDYGRSGDISTTNKVPSKKVILKREKMA